MHACDATRSMAYDLDIPLIFNMPYRPEFNGIENLWAHAKAQYKRMMLGNHAMGKSWKNQEVVPELIMNVPNDVIIEGLKRGERNL